MTAIRRAHVVWTGDLLQGRGVIDAACSAAYQQLPVTWAARTGSTEQGKTSPEELLASAHASCFCMALSLVLGKAGHAPEKLDVVATVTFEQTPAGYRVKSSTLELKGRVPGMDAPHFQQAAEDAKENCPISQALKGNVKISLSAALA